MSRPSVLRLSWFCLIAASLANAQTTLKPGWPENSIKLMAPPNCKGAQCSLFVEVQKLDVGYHFTLEASDSQYVSVGLTQTAMMSTGSIVECVAVNNTMHFYQSTTGGPPNTIEGARTYWRLPQNLEDRHLIWNATGSTNDKRIHCEFVRNAVSSVNNTVYDMNSFRYYLQVASGALKENSTAIKHHSKWATTLRPVSFVHLEGALASASNVKPGNEKGSKASTLSFASCLLVLSAILGMRAVI